MRRLTASCLFTLLALFAGLPGALLASAETGEGLDLAAHPRVESAVKLLDLWIREQMAHQRLPGLSLGVVHDQDLVWAAGYGYADVEKQIPATPETVYRAGSITKLFTSTAVLQLRDEGKLRLDDPVVKHLPWFQMAETFPGAPEITVRHLLTHTSGLPREGAFPYWTEHVFPSREELREALAGQKPVYPPGQEIKYSNLGMALLGEIVIAVDGRPWAEAVQARILQPLGMESSSGDPGPELLARAAVAYFRRPQEGERQVFDYYDTGAIAPAANLVSTVEDLARFASLQFREGKEAGGGQILKASTLAEMHRPHALNEAWTSARGLGFGVSRKDDRTLVSHGGWVGGNRSHLLLWPEAKVAVIVMTNADDASPSFFSSQALEVVGEAIHEASAPPPPPPTGPDPAWQAYVGRYTDPWAWEYEVLILNGGLVFYEHNYPPEDEAEASVTRLVPVAEHTFRLPDGELVVFELGEDGSVQRIRRRSEYLLPVAP